jgi:hypothetical protein
MGLRKLTQWEETVAKQEQKQFRLMSVAIVCVIAMCVVLWLVQDQLYGDVVRTGAAAYGCSFIGVAIGLFVRSTTGETWATSSEKRKKFEMALIGIFIVLVIGGAIFLEEFRLAAVQLLCAYIPIFWILKKRKADCDENCLLACMFILMTVMVLVGTFVGVKLMGLTTLPAVEKKIAVLRMWNIIHGCMAVGLIWMKITRRNTTFFKRKRMDRSGRLPPTRRAVSLCRLRRQRIDAPCRNRKFYVE